MSLCRQSTRHHADEEGVDGLSAVLDGAQLPERVRAGLASEILDLGAVNVRELTGDDWEGLRSWKILKPRQRRRL